ncbi:MAG: MFS transporter [Rickettsiales bacterium]|nr:MFS transporter [Rickettsiales bacterium]
MGSLRAGLIASTFSVVSMAIEIPTGAISDYFGSKKTLVGGLLFYLLGYVIILFKKNFFTFCLFHGFAGIYETMFTGAKESLVYNNIKYLDLMDDFVLHKNRSKTFQYIALMLSSFTAGKLVIKKYNANYLIMIDIVILIAYIMLVHSMNEHSNKNLRKLNTGYMKSIGNGLKYMFIHRSLRKMIIFRAVWISIFRLLLSYSSLFYREIFRNLKLVGYIASSEILISALLQYLIVKYFAKKKNIYYDALLFVIGSLAALMSSIIYRGWISYPLIVVYFSCIKASELIFFSRMQKLIPSKSRAVIVSASNFLNSMLRLIISLSLSFISSKYSYKMAFCLIFAFFNLNSLIFFLYLLADRHIYKMESRIRAIHSC